MSEKKTFEAFTNKILSEDDEEIPDAIKTSAETLSIYEKRFGTEATFKMVEKTVEDEIRNDDGSDPGYVEYLLKFLHEMKTELGRKRN